jgi:integrase/recombinase XerC
MLPAGAELIDRYIDHLHHERRMSPHTSKNYRRDLDQLASWCGTQQIERWEQLTGRDLRGFAAAAFRKGLAPRTIQRQLSATRSFFRYLLREGLVRANPADGITAPKVNKRLPGTLDVDTMAALLSIPGDEPLVRRDRAMLELLYSSGLRLAELIGLDIGSVAGADATVRVLGKGAKERIVPVGRAALRALEGWMAVRGSMAPAGERALFVTRRGNRLSPRTVQARVKYWARRQGIDSRVYPHLFRHSFATHVLESSRDLRGVQELLGHADIATTQIYTHLDFQHLAQIYDQTHPRARRREED